MADIEFAGANGEEQYMESTENTEQAEYEQGEADNSSANPGDKINASKNDEDDR